METKSVRIKGLAIEFEGSDAAAGELIKTIAGLMAPTIIKQPAVQMLAAPIEAPAICHANGAAVEKLAPAAAKKAKPRKKWTRRTPPAEAPPTKEDPGDDSDGDRFAARGSELAQKICDRVKLDGPMTVGELAIGLRRAATAIGRSVSASDQLRKGTDGKVYAID